MARSKTAQVPLKAYTIPQFCAAYQMSVRHFYDLRERGIGPKEMRHGRSVLVSFESAEQWAHDCEEGVEMTR
jgi:hypothetical protein